MKLKIDNKEYLIDSADNSVYFEGEDTENIKRLVVTFSSEEDATLDDLVALRGTESTFQIELDDTAATNVSFTGYSIYSIRKNYGTSQKFVMEFIEN